MKADDARLHLSLAEVYLGRGRRHEAVAALERGLKCVKRCGLLKRALRRFGERRTPVLTFLGRGHFLNRCAGKARHFVLELLGGSLLKKAAQRLRPAGQVETGDSAKAAAVRSRIASLKAGSRAF